MAQYINARDMVDGGGAGRSGQRFEGGILADIANALGFKPAGYRERLESARPAQRQTAQPTAFSAPPAAPSATASTVGDLLTSNGGGLAEQRQAGGASVAMPSLGMLLSSDADRMAAQGQNVPFSAPFPTLGDMLSMDADRRADLSASPSFTMPAATTAAATANAAPQMPPQSKESDAERIKRQLAESGLVLPDGVLGALLPTLQRMPRISQQRDFVAQYLRKNNLAPATIGPAVNASF